jgi:nitrate/nitrite-specific signal transduction histidine kinase
MSALATWASFGMPLVAKSAGSELHVLSANAVDARTTSKSGSSLRMQLYKFFGFAVSEKREPDEFKSRFWQESFQIRIDKSD